MANKVAIAGSILGFLLAFFASIPVGIIFIGGLTGMAGIPLDLYHSGSYYAFIWGRTGLTVESWFVVADLGIIYGVCLFVLAVAAAALAFGGAFMKGKAGRTTLLVAFIFSLVVLGISIIDWLVIGIGVAHAAGAVVGGGMYLLITEAVLLFVAFRWPPKEV
jgi:hypothetical protein